MHDCHDGEELASERRLEIVVAGEMGEGGREVRTGGDATDDEAAMGIRPVEGRG